MFLSLQIGLKLSIACKGRVRDELKYVTKQKWRKERTLLLSIVCKLCVFQKVKIALDQTGGESSHNITVSAMEAVIKHECALMKRKYTLIY